VYLPSSGPAAVLCGNAGCAEIIINATLFYPMVNESNIPSKLTAVFVYGRPPLVFGGLVCAVAVMWSRSLVLYETGVLLLLVSMSFDMVDGWFAARYPPHPTLADLADRIMDKIVYSTIFPLVAVGMMWRLIFIEPAHTRPEMLHAILVLLLCISVLIRDNFAHFIRSSAIQQGIDPETREFTRLRAMVAAPVGVLLYMHAFFLPARQGMPIYVMISWVEALPLRYYFLIEILFLIMNFGSIAAFCRKYGTLCLDDVCHEDDLLRHRILSLFPNALTLLNALMGILAVLFAHQGWIRQAYLFLIGAAIFDKLDGALARRLGLTETVSRQNRSATHLAVGSVLDDIADGVSFCLAPALIFYMTLADHPALPFQNRWLGAIAGFYFVMGVARLIYFTLDKTPIPGFFKGMPTPAAALLIIAPVLLFNQAAIDSSTLTFFWVVVCIVIILAASLAMNIYPVHYLHLGRFMDKNPWFRNINILLLLGSMFTPFFGHVALVYLLLYLFSPLMTRGLEPH
jgi:CDP-diacylglycerol--serine O-phosphatidyltransferase